MSGETEVIVGRQVDDLLAVEAGFRRAGGFENAQALVGAFALPLFELVVEVREWFDRHQTSVSPGIAGRFGAGAPRVLRLNCLA